MAMLAWIKGLFRRPTVAVAPAGRRGVPLATPPPREAGDVTPVWSVVANVLHKRPYGPGGVEKRSGTKHFAPGAKVFVIAFYWGMGAESVTVIGRHRKSHRYICIDMRAVHLANWRAELVHSPWVIRHVHERGELKRVWVGAEKRWVEGADTEYARRRADEIAAGYLARGAATQPFTTRPPSTS
jgi:hypothetical protein